MIIMIMIIIIIIYYNSGRGITYLFSGRAFLSADLSLKYCRYWGLLTLRNCLVFIFMNSLNQCFKIVAFCLE